MAEMTAAGQRLILEDEGPLRCGAALGERLEDTGHLALQTYQRARNIIRRPLCSQGV